MAHELSIGAGHVGRIRSFWVGLGLTVLTLGVYSSVWYYRLNQELRDMGDAAGDAELAQTRPAHSLLAALIGSILLLPLLFVSGNSLLVLGIGSILLVPLLVSMYRFAARIRLAQELAGIAENDQIDPGLAFASLFGGLFVLLPLFYYYWYVTKHQNRALCASAALVPAGELVLVA